MAQEQSFTATVQIAGVNPYVEVPPRLVEALGGGGKVPVLVKVSAPGVKRKREAGARKGRLAKDAPRLRAIGRLAAGGWFRSTVLTSPSNPPRLYLDTWMREAAGKGHGSFAARHAVSYLGP